MTTTRNPAPASQTPVAGRGYTPVRHSTVRRALARIQAGTVRTRDGGPRNGAPGISVRTLHTLDDRGLVRFGSHVPGLGRPVRPTRAGSRALIARGPNGTAAWPWLLRQENVWMGADGQAIRIADMPAPYCANAAAWLQRNAALIRRYAEPARRLDAVQWIDGTPLMRALLTAAAAQ